MPLRCFCPQMTHRSPLVGLTEFGSKRRRCCLWECSSSASQSVVTAIEGRELKKSSDEMGLNQETRSVTLHRDLSLLPRICKFHLYSQVLSNGSSQIIEENLLLIPCYHTLQNHVNRPKQKKMGCGFGIPQDFPSSFSHLRSLTSNSSLLRQNS